MRSGSGLLLTLLCAHLACVLSASLATAESRVALVIGNGAYVNTTPLTNPLNDARLMSQALKSTGFDVVEALDADKRKIDGALRVFTEKLTHADIALFYYAGHGLQVGAQNYLVPTDAKLERERDLEFEAVKLDFVLRQMEIDREGKTTIVMLDACRDNPLARTLARSMGTRSAGIGRGLAAAATGLGTFIAYATQPGNVALDGEGKNSPFTTALAKHMLEKGRNLNATMIEVRKEVVSATNGQQVPWDHSALTGDFFFSPGEGAPVGTVAPAPPGNNADIAALQARLAKLEAEAKARDAADKAAAASAASQSAKPVASVSGFEVADNTAISGTAIRIIRASDDTTCREVCEKEGNCAGYQQGKLKTNRDVCELFSSIHARKDDPGWRSAVKRPPAQPAAVQQADATKLAELRKVRDTTRIFGEQYKTLKQPTADACSKVCAADPQCKGFNYGRKEPVQSTCALFRSVSRSEDDALWQSARVEIPSSVK